MKRFTDTAKWAKSWFHDLDPTLKCLWLYICDHADNAGVWEPNWSLASHIIGKKVTEANLSAFGGRVVRLKGGKLWLESFVTFQYGKLSRDCRPHVKIFESLAKNGILYDETNHTVLVPSDRVSGNLDTLSETSSYPTNGRDKEEEEDKEEDKEEERESPEREAVPEEPFVTFWKAYPRRIGKGTAETAWRKHGCNKLLPEILVAVKRCAASPDWKKECGQFIPHPATWLNRKGWEDELALPVKSGKGPGWLPTVVGAVTTPELPMSDDDRAAALRFTEEMEARKMRKAL